VKCHLGTAGIALLLLASAVAEAQTRPNLRESAVSTSATAVRAGEKLQVSDTAVNAGGSGAPPSRTQYRLVPTGAHPHGYRVALGSRAVPALGPGDRSTGSRRVRVPRALTPRGYRLLACADASHVVRESHERDNCRAAGHTIKVLPDAPPAFAGLQSAVTCIAGPAGGGRSSAYTLTWKAASDDGTPPDKLVYDVYQATSAGAEDFSVPTYSSEHGAISFRTPELATASSYYFVVRARDASGVRDDNRVERPGQNICD
jgi:hypothetical protein